MTYAGQRILYDADSHLMELPNFLVEHADAATREILRPFNFGSGRIADQIQDIVDAGGHSAQRIDEMVALGDALLTGPKNYLALGAFDRAERTRALDLLGFKAQLVFPTFSAGVLFFKMGDETMRHGAALALNRAMAAFCADDPRLLGVGAIPLEDPTRALEATEQLIGLGLGAAWVPHQAAGGRSPGHCDFDPVWARLQEAGIPFVLHIGGNALQLHPSWMNTGTPLPKDWLGGAENVRGKDMTSLHHKVETFISSMVLDGVFERHRKLRGAVVELGAGYVPSMLDRLDSIVANWGKSEPGLKALTRKPSEQIIEHLSFTPFIYEDVGKLIRQSDPRLYLFSSDYPHIEGGRFPVEKFEASLSGLPAEAAARFFHENFAEAFQIG